LIIENLKNIDMDYIFEGFCDSDRLDILKFLIDNYNIKNPNIMSIFEFYKKHNNIDIFIENDYDINKETDRTTLIVLISCHKDREKIIKYFLDKGLAIKKKDIAYFIRQPNIIELLIQHGIELEHITEALIDHMKKNNIFDILDILYNHNVNVPEYLNQVMTNFAQK